MFFDDDYDGEYHECVDCGKQLLEDDDIFYSDEDEPLCQKCWENEIGYD